MKFYFKILITFVCFSSALFTVASADIPDTIDGVKKLSVNDALKQITTCVPQRQCIFVDTRERNQTKKGPQNLKPLSVRYEMKDENSFDPDAFMKALKKARYKKYKNYSKLKKTRIYVASAGEGSPSSYYFLKAFIAHMGDKIKSQKIKLFWVREGGAPAMVREIVRNPKPYMKKEYVKE